MAQVIITFKIMPVSPETDLDRLYEKVDEIMKKYSIDIGKKEVVPVAFGLKSLNLICVMDENLGSTENMEKEVSELEEVNSIDVIDIRRAIG